MSCVSVCHSADAAAAGAAAATSTLPANEVAPCVCARMCVTSVHSSGRFGGRGRCAPAPTFRTSTRAELKQIFALTLRGHAASMSRRLCVLRPLTAPTPLDLTLSSRYISVCSGGAWRAVLYLHRLYKCRLICALHKFRTRTHQFFMRHGASFVGADSTRQCC